ncbi:nucleotidyltransferase [Peribacillus butanolivorans]|uniref:nucleotidyltransferase domain-containing protein n=1 Tax=Peribacillus butanolivorans TaxID=421767 RepID=UPI00207D45A2|nr:nucleotidyltransferase [Peribacillus butanolivorans]MCO0597277.1 nucleotidyltransferase [Peribacillus butanolivorans]
MAIPNSQLEIWSNQGATATPKALREKIERVLRADSSLITNKHSVSIYLQGSYRNSTNIYGNSDVDIVVQTNNVFYGDVSGLFKEKRDIYNSLKNPSQYTWGVYKEEVLNTLKNYFGFNNIEIGNKSIKIDTGVFEADVVPCIQYKKYIDYGYSVESQKYIEGMKFYTTKDSREVINYPKRHYSFGVEKNQQTGELYKKSVRIFKNIKSRLVDSDKLDKSTAPSYFVENLLFNVPNDKFVRNNYSQTIFNILKWLDDNRNNLSSFICQNGMVNLFGTTQEQWDESDAKIFINECISLWNEW